MTNLTICHPLINHISFISYTAAAAATGNATVAAGAAANAYLAPVFQSVPVKSIGSSPTTSKLIAFLSSSSVIKPKLFFFMLIAPFN